MAGTGQRGKGCFQNPGDWTARSRNGEKQREQVKMNVLVTPNSLLSWKLGSVIPRSPGSSLYAIKNYTESHSIWGNHQEQNRMHCRRNTLKGKFFANSFSSRLYQDNTFVVSPTLSSCVYLLPVPQEAEERAENSAWEYSSVLPSHSSRTHREVSTGQRCSRCGKEVHREGTHLLCTWCVPGPSFMCLAPIILQNLAMILLPLLPQWRSCGGPENVGSLSKIKQYTNYSPRTVSGNGSPSLSTGEYTPNASGCSESKLTPAPYERFALLHTWIY